GVGARVQLVAVVETVAVTVDPHALPAPLGDAADRDLAARGREAAQIRYRDRALRVAVPLEIPVAAVYQAARLPVDHALGDEVTLILVGLRDQRIEGADQARVVVVRAVEGDLIAHGRRHARVEGEQERLDVAALVVALGTGREGESG